MAGISTDLDASVSGVSGSISSISGVSGSISSVSGAFGSISSVAGDSASESSASGAFTAAASSFTGASILPEHPHIVMPVTKSIMNISAVLI